MNFYELFGLGVDCTEDDLKRAFRRLSKQHHPDIPGGDAETFREIETAYRVLSDPDERAYYDTHGRVRPDAAEINKNAELYQLRQQAMMAAIADIEDPAQFDMIEAMKKKLAEHRAMTVEQHKGPKAQLKKFETARNRIKNKKGDNVLSALLGTMIEGLSKSLADADKLIALDDAATEFLKDYKFTYAKNPGQDYGVLNVSYQPFQIFGSP